MKNFYEKACICSVPQRYILLFSLGRKMEAGNFVRGEKSKNTELKRNM